MLINVVVGGKHLSQLCISPLVPRRPLHVRHKLQSEAGGKGVRTKCWVGEGRGGVAWLNLNHQGPSAGLAF